MIVATHGRLNSVSLPAIMRRHGSIRQQKQRITKPMSVTTVHTEQPASSLRGLLPVWVGAAIYALMVLAGNRLLADPDTLWQITVGQWIIDHHAVPTEDVYSFTMRGQPWISTQWLSQVL